MFVRSLKMFAIAAAAVATSGWGLTGVAELNTVRIFAVFIGTLMVGAALAQDATGFPSKPMKFYVGFPPGGSTDIVSRVLAQRLQERMGQPVIVEQKVGATGVIAQDAVSKAPPDGHTFVLLPGGHPSAAVIMKQLPYDPVKGFAMVSLVTQYPMTVMVNPAAPMKTFGELIERARAEPGKLSYSSSGIGSLHHLLGEWINLEAGVQMVHVPFKGAAPAFTELLANRIDVYFWAYGAVNVLYLGLSLLKITVRLGRFAKPAPVEAALRARFSPEALDGVSVAAAGLSNDLHGNAAYRAHLIGVMARRAVLAATR